MAIQSLDQPFNNSQLVDGVLNDKPMRTTGLDGLFPDVAIINTKQIDSPVVAAIEPTVVTIPIV